MGARHKLNRSYLNGSLLLAGLTGWLLRSWLVFVFALAVLLALNLSNREIRPPRDRC
jgi:hypothetical protein